MLSGQNHFNIDLSRTYCLKSRCEDVLKDNNYILSASSLLFYWDNSDSSKQISIGDSLTVYSKLYPIRDNSNTGEFSYNRYLKQKGINYKVFPVTAPQISGHSDNVFSIFQTVRSRLTAKTDLLVKDSTYNAILKALCLGYRNDLDSETKNLFTDTGTIHLLSVSGLHTGAIYLLIAYLFRLIGIRNGRVYLLIIPLLWAYACTTGLSPSVIRASTILTFVTIGKVFERDYTPLNSIAASAFFTLLLQPAAIYSISFQMSYSAYTGIVTIYPLLNKLQPKLHRFLVPLYSLLCVSIAAQIPTLPLTAYYFHTISVNSFLANIIAVPIATILLYAGTILLIIPTFIGIHISIIIEWIGQALLLFLHYFSKISINSEDLYFSCLHIILFYLCLISAMIFIIHQKKLYFRLFLLSITLLIAYTCSFNFSISNRKEIVIFHAYNQSCILLNHEGYYYYLKNNQTNPDRTRPYIKKNQLKEIAGYTGFISSGIQYTDNRFKYTNRQIYIADRYNTDIEDADILIITDGTSPEHLFSQKRIYYPEQIIVDGSNKPYINKKWEKFCYEKGIILTQTNENGSIIISLK